MDRLRAEFGVWGRPISPATTYSRYRVRFEGGASPAACRSQAMSDNTSDVRML